MAKTSVDIEVFPSVWAFDDLVLYGGVHKDVELNVAQHKAVTAAAAAGVLKVSEDHPEGVESDEDSLANQRALEEEAFDPETGSQDTALYAARRDGTEDELLAYRAEQEKINDALLVGDFEVVNEFEGEDEAA